MRVRTIRSCAAGALALCAVLSLVPVRPVGADPLSPQEVLQAPTLAPYSPASFSPDNRLLAYVVTDNARRAAVAHEDLVRSGLAWYGIAADIWITDLSTGKKENLTHATGHNWSPQWSPDGRYVAFLADRSSQAQLGPARLWVWERTTGALRQIGDADVRHGFKEIQWANEREVLVNLFPEGMSRDNYVTSTLGTAPAAKAERSTALIFEFDPAVPGAAPSTDQINLDFWRRDLGLIDVETGKLRRLVQGARIGHYALSPDGRQIAYSTLQRAQEPGAGQYLYDVVVQNLATAHKRSIASDVRMTLVGSPLAWAPTSDRIAWRTGGPLADDEIYIATVAKGSGRQVARNPRSESPDVLLDIPPMVWDAAGRHVFFVRDGTLWRAHADGSGAARFAETPNVKLALLAPRQQRLFSPDQGRSAIMLSWGQSTKRAGFMRIDLQSGAATQLLEEDKRYGGYEVEPTISSDGSRVAYVAEGPLDAPDVFVLGGADLHGARKVSEVAPALTGRSFGKAQLIEWRSTEGTTQHGALVFPADYRAGNIYPLIVKVYGGSALSDDLNRFGYASAAFENLQLFATRGYALLLADSDLRVGSPMFDLLKSVMPGIDKAVELGVADPARIGITGHSHGGYSTLALIAQSSRFKAAVMRAGTGNLISGYGHLLPDGTNPGIAWSESGQGRMGGSLWEFRERYIENSPIFYLDRVTTPLLIVHGEQDSTVPAFLADEVFTDLRRLGKPVTYLRYRDEGHWEGQWSYANQLDVLNRVIAWFDRYLKGTVHP